MVLLDKNGKPTGYAKCSKCGEIKPFSDFHKKKTTKYGIKSNCKLCAKKERSEYYSNNKEREFENHRRYEDQNKERINSRRSERRKENPDYYKEHHQYVMNRRIHDIEFSLFDRIRKRMVRAFSVGEAKASFSYRSLIGIKTSDYVGYIENQLVDGMNWDRFNSGEIQIDHIIPCSSFDLSNPKNQKVCFNFLNTRPMWTSENLSRRHNIELTQTEVNALLDSIELKIKEWDYEA
jgi:hypothetical protein